MLNCIYSKMKWWCTHPELTALEQNVSLECNWEDTSSQPHVKAIVQYWQKLFSVSEGDLIHHNFSLAKGVAFWKQNAFHHFQKAKCQTYFFCYTHYVPQKQIIFCQCSTSGDTFGAGCSWNEWSLAPPQAGTYFRNASSLRGCYPTPNLWSRSILGWWTYVPCEANSSLYISKKLRRNSHLKVRLETSF